MELFIKPKVTCAGIVSTIHNNFVKRFTEIESVQVYAHFADEYLALYAGNSEKVNEEFNGTGFESVTNF